MLATATGRCSSDITINTEEQSKQMHNYVILQSVAYRFNFTG